MSTATASPFAKSADNTDYNNGEGFERPPSGLHPAVLVSLIDLGTHEFFYQGKKSENRKIFLTWELTAEHMLDGTTFLISADYTWSLGKSANFRHMLEAWSGRAFSDKEEFDPLKLLGLPCVVTVSEGLSAKGKKFTEIVGVANPMKGQTLPPATRKTFAWHMSMITCQDDPIELPDWTPRIYGRLVIDDIKGSKEWLALPKISAEHALDNPIGAPAANGAPVEDKPPF